jgi:hypothetical protein
MLLSFSISGKQYSAETSDGMDISIPMIFNGQQPNTYDVEIASSKAVETTDFIGDTRRGGSCNFEEVRLIPHCNGTHTECVGHISYERISVYETLRDTFIPAMLITVTPLNPENTKDVYDPELNPNDLLITADLINGGVKKFDNDFLNALIIRTKPNDVSKRSRRYIENQPPFFSVDAMKLISQLNVNHLLVDIPSVDRTFDEGKLSAHHIYWDVKRGSHDVDTQNHSLKTITEMIYVPDEVEDGVYLLNLQIAPFVSDASPSRPVLFRINN